MYAPVTVRRDHQGWWMVRCPNYHPPGLTPVLGYEQLWEDAMVIADQHCPTNHDPIGDCCDEAWTLPTRAPAIQYGRNIDTLPDIDRFEEQQ